MLCSGFGPSGFLRLAILPGTQGRAIQTAEVPGLGHTVSGEILRSLS